MNLEQLRSRTSSFLADSAGLIWPDGLLDEAVRQALDDYSLVQPQLCSTEVNALPGNPAIFDLSGLAGFIGLLGLRWGSQPAIQPYAWLLQCNDASRSVKVVDGFCPPPGEPVWAVYFARHTIEGLDEAQSTTVDQLHDGLLVRGAAAYAAQIRCVDRAEGFLPEAGAQRLADWAKEQMETFQSGLRDLRWSDPFTGMVITPQGGWGTV